MSISKTVVIGCAGIGSRLGLGQSKALINIHGKPLIHWQLELLAEVEDVRVVVGYQANEVIKTILEVRKMSLLSLIITILTPKQPPVSIWLQLMQMIIFSL